jgi:hypothetical protein
MNRTGVGQGLAEHHRLLTAGIQPPGGIHPGGGQLGGGQGGTMDPLDQLQQAIDNALPANAPERTAIDAGIAALKASPEAAAVRMALSQFCASMTPVNPPAQTPATGVSPGAAAGIGAGGLVVGALVGFGIGRSGKRR